MQIISSDSALEWQKLARVTNELSWCFPVAQKWMFEACTEEQIERYVLPMMRGERLKVMHNRCSMVKLYVSEIANPVADRTLQIFGGRGYMRENVAERFFRELQVDRIREGTSEIQRLIIARGLLQRGLDQM